ncbi:protein translocase subunit SecF [Candidatus Parcubacteria bacterium]|nr:protein translocase subunit SecF [Candidatus Parcubacteria bacterium]
MFVIKHRKIFYGISIAMVAISLFAIFNWGIKFGIDFAGGSILEVEYTETKTQKEIVIDDINSLGLEKEFSVRETGEAGYIIRSTTLTDTEKNQIISAIGEQNPVEEIRFNTVGPTLGKELVSKGITAFMVIVISIILFVAYTFREVSKPVSSWKYGFVSILAFVHDVLVPVGLFAFLGQFYGIEVDTLFIVAILVVLGYSINDTIVVFDRIRDNLKKVKESERKDKFEKVVGKSLKQVYARSINTSITTLIALVAIFIWGGESTKWFSLALITGVIAGTYSSIFFASPMLVTLSKMKPSAKKVEKVEESEENK